MMQGKHTPGPWVVNFRSDGSSYICMGGIKPGQQHKQFNLALDQMDGNDEADARLIAAAPDMLEALRLALELFEDGLVDFGKYGLETDADIGKLYRVAIARATGCTQ